MRTMSAAGVYPGWDTGVGREGLYRVLPMDHPRTHIDLNLASEPYLRPNEGYFQLNDEVSETGSRMGPEYDQN